MQIHICISFFRKVSIECTANVYSSFTNKCIDSLLTTYLLCIIWKAKFEICYHIIFMHREYILRAAVLLVTGALTINPESIFSGNIAWFGLQQGCSAETEPFFDLLSLALPKWLSFGPFFKLQFNEVKLTNHFFVKHQIKNILKSYTLKLHTNE